MGNYFLPIRCRHIQVIRGFYGLDQKLNVGINIHACDKDIDDHDKFLADNDDNDPYGNNDCPGSE